MNFLSLTLLFCLRRNSRLRPWNCEYARGWRGWSSSFERCGCARPGNSINFDLFWFARSLPVTLFQDVEPRKQEPEIACAAQLQLSDRELPECLVSQLKCENGNGKGRVRVPVLLYLNHRFTIGFTLQEVLWKPQPALLIRHRQNPAVPVRLKARRSRGYPKTPKGASPMPASVSNWGDFLAGHQGNWLWQWTSSYKWGRACFGLSKHVETRTASLWIKGMSYTSRRLQGQTARTETFFTVERHTGYF